MERKMNNIKICFILFILFFLVIPVQLFSQNYDETPVFDPNSTEPFPYQPNEFPEGVNDLRRFEQILIGSFPLSILFSQLFASAGMFIDSAIYSDTPTFNFGTENLRTDDKVRIIGASIGISFGIAIIDMAIYQTKKNQAISEYQRKRVLSTLENEETDEENNANDPIDSADTGIKREYPIDNTFSELVAPESIGE